MSGNAANLGAAYITVAPRFDNLSGSVNKAISSVDVSPAGSAMGGKLSGAFSRVFAKASTSQASKTFDAISNSGNSAFQKIGGYASAGFHSVNSIALSAMSGTSAVISSSLGDAFKKGMALAKTAVKVGMGAITAGIGYAVKTGMDAYDTLARFSQTMNFAGIASDQIESVKKEMVDYTKQTVYQLNDVMNTTAQLGANGVKDFDKVTQALGNINAASGGSAESFKLAAAQLVQMNAAGKVSYADWKVFAQDMPGASKIIKDELKDMGAYQGEFNEALKNGEVSADEFDQALQNIGFEDAAKDATSTVSTFDSAFGEIADTVSLDMGKVEAAFADTGTLTDFTNTATGAIDKVAKFIEDHAPEIKQGIDGLATGIGELMRGVKDSGALETFANIINDLYTYLSSDDASTGNSNLYELGYDLGLIANALAAPIEALINFKKALDDVDNKIKSFSKDGQGFELTDPIGSFQNLDTDKVSQAINDMLSPLENLSGIVDLPNQIFTPIANGLISIGDTVSGFFNALPGQIMGGLSFITGIPNMLFEPIASGLISAGGAISGFFSNLGPTIMGGLASAGAFLQGIPGMIVGFFQGVPGAIGGFLSTALPGPLVSAFSGAASTVAGVPGQIAGFFTSVPGAVRGFIGSVPGVVGGVFSSAAGSVQGIPGRISGFFSGITGQVSGAFSGIPGAIGGIFNSLVNTVSSIPDRIVGFFSGIGERISRAFGSIHFPQPSIDWTSVDVMGQSISIPKISFHASGGVFDHLSVFGEKDPEMVTPLNRRSTSPFADLIAERMSANGFDAGADPKVLALLSQLVEGQNNGVVLLDGKALVGALAEQVSRTQRMVG